MNGWFETRKAAQLVAFFCAKEGGEIDVLKLVKLVYLSDRKFLSECGYPITNDKHVSMPHGPANSITLNLIDGNIESPDWGDLLATRADNRIALRRELSIDDNDEFSDAEAECLEGVWAEFGHMTKYEIRDWTHDNCPEWENPHGSSTPIPVSRILQFLGIENAEHQALRIEANREFRATLNSLGADSAY